MLSRKLCCDFFFPVCDQARIISLISNTDPLTTFLSPGGFLSDSLINACRWGKFNPLFYSSRNLHLPLPPPHTWSSLIKSAALKSAHLLPHPLFHRFLYLSLPLISSCLSPVFHVLFFMSPSLSFCTLFPVRPPFLSISFLAPCMFHFFPLPPPVLLLLHLVAC